MTDWQPIETAPKDGTEFRSLTYLGEGITRITCVEGVEYVETRFPHDVTIKYPFEANPTHWLPLPQPPEER